MPLFAKIWKKLGHEFHEWARIDSCPFVLLTVRSFSQKQRFFATEFCTENTEEIFPVFSVCFFPWHFQ